MSNSSLASVSIDLISNNASFVAGLSKAEASLKTSVGQMGKSISGLGDMISKSLGSVGGNIGAELSGVFSGLGSAVSEMASKMSAAKGLTGALSIGLGGLAAVGISAAAALSGLALSGGELAESLAFTSQKTGIGIRDLQTLQAAGSVVGVSLDDITMAMGKFSEAIIGTGRGGSQLSGVMKSLGVTSRDSNEALLQVADAFAKMPDGPQKSAYAVELFGKSGKNLIPLLDKGSAGLQEFSDIVTQFGPNIDQNAVAAMEKWKVSTLTLSESWDRFKTSLAGSVSILAKIVDGAAGVTKAVADMSTALAKHTKQSLGALAQGGIMGLFASSELSATSDNSGNSAVNAKQRAQTDAQNALIAKQQELFEIMQAGGEAEYNLAQKKQQIETDTQAGDYASALLLQQQIPVLQEAADKEKQRAAAAKAAVAAHEKLLDLIARQGSGQIKVTNVFRQEPKLATPDLTSTAEQYNGVSDALQRLANVGGVTDAVLKMGSDAVADFYKELDKDNRDTIDVINQRFASQLDNFKGLLALQAISQQSFNDVSKALETERVAEIQKIQQKSGTDFAVSFASAFAQIADASDKLAGNIADNIGGALKGLSDQTAQLMTTGHANFGQVGKSLEGNLAKSGTDALLGTATKGIGSLFGVKFGKPDGTEHNPIYTKSADGIADHVKSLGNKLNVGSIGKDLSGAFSGISGIFSKLLSSSGGGGIGSIFGGLLGGLGSIFGGFRADGGSVTPGYSYMVGERGAERFVPTRPGQIVPNHAMAAGSKQPIVNNIHFNGVQDMDSFRQSQDHILGHLGNAVGRAISRR